MLARYVYVPETAGVLSLLKDGDIRVAESGEEASAADAGWTTSNHRYTTAVRLRQICRRHTTVAHLWNTQTLEHLHNNTPSGVIREKAASRANRHSLYIGPIPQQNSNSLLRF